MTTDPGDLVLDITCGSGTTAYVAEQWGRRWITCDTSRVAIDLTKQRLMTATYDYYRLAHPEQGVDSGFVYKTVPHITLKSIANNYPPATETLYDQPEIDKTKIRVTGPFTVESLPATTVKPIDGEENEVVSDMTAKQDEYREEILATGVIGKAGEKLEFTRVEAAPATFAYVQAIGETKEDKPPLSALLSCGGCVTFSAFSFSSLVSFSCSFKTFTVVLASLSCCLSSSSLALSPSWRACIYCLARLREP